VDLVSAVINEARRYPMMGDKQVIFLRECQSLDKKNLFDKLALYLENPQPTSIIVLTYKHGTADRRKKWVSAIDKVGVVFESKKLYENEASVFITDTAKKNDLKITADASRLLLELVGADLTQIESIMKKFSIMLTKDRTITPELVEQTTGVNKDYTPFELLTAIINGDARKANRIILNTSANIVAIIAILFNYFSNLFIYEYMPDHSPANVASTLKINPYRVKEFEQGAKRFNKMKCFKIIGYLREYDCKSKGIGAANASDVDLLKELIFKILN
jgi:DNA polymerase-3 subunit delta